MKSTFSGGTRSSSAVALTLCVALCFSGEAKGQRAWHWVGSWAAAPMKLDNRKGTLGATDCTVRNIVHLSLGGKAMRVVVSNEMGTTPLTIGAAEVALSSGDAGIAKGTSKVITFEGSPSVTIPAGVKIFSDSVPIDLPFQANVAISLFLPAQPIPFVTAHSYGNQANFIAPGNGVGAPALANAVETDMWQFVSAVEVQAPPEGAAIVTLGDSITDGAFSTRSANLRWPDDLARRLHANQKTSSLAVLNEGIGGNRVLHGENGQFVVDSALARFDRDVLSQAGVRYLVLLEGINDIGIATKPENPGAAVTASDLILGITQLIERAHAHGIRVYVGTIMADKGLGFYYSDAGEKLRQAVDEWIRTNKLSDGVIDFDKALRDPQDPQRLLPAFDHDHIHPNDAGHQAMADAIDLALFTQ